MSQSSTQTTVPYRRALRAGAQVALLVVMVPLGIAGGWFVLSPSSQMLAERASTGADRTALLELVNRAQFHPDSARELETLLGQDAGALQALAELAAGHEKALMCLISMARIQPEAMDRLAGLKLTYPFAREMLRHMAPAGMPALRQSAETCANAMFMLGVAYETGSHTPQSWQQAAQWYYRALDMGYQAAAPYYAMAAYEAGLECQSSPELAVSWFRAAAESGHAAAQCALGVHYASGEGVVQNQAAAVEWYRRSAEQDFVDAQFNLGWCYLHGEGVEADSVAAAEWFRKAAARGDDLAQYYLGRAYELGEGVSRDPHHAVHWYTRAAEQGNAAAQYALGHCYARGLGVSQNWQQAVYWYQLSAEQGRAEAQLALATCYKMGLGVAQDAARDRYWRDRASLQSQPTIPES